MNPVNLNAYRVVEETGKDVLGTLYHAVQLSTGNIVQLRVLSKSMTGDDGFRAQFDSIKSRLLRPPLSNRLRILDFNEQEGTYYLLTEMPEAPEWQEIFAYLKEQEAHGKTLDGNLIWGAILALGVKMTASNTTGKETSAKSSRKKASLAEAVAPDVMASTILPRETIKTRMQQWWDDSDSADYLRKYGLVILIFILLAGMIGYYYQGGKSIRGIMPEMIAQQLPRIRGDIPYDKYAVALSKDSSRKSESANAEDTTKLFDSDTTAHTPVGTLDITLSDASAPYATPLKKYASANAAAEETRKTDTVKTKKESSDDGAAGINPVVTVPPGMVLAPGGIYPVGSDSGIDNEKPKHKLMFPSFYIDRYEVTNAQYADFLKASKHPIPSHWFNTNPPLGQDMYPVTNITWLDAYSYCTWAGKRLPTEEEWERAARGNTDRLYPWGDEFTSSIANTWDSGFNSLQVVGKFPGNLSAIGTYDQCGNASEWTLSEYQAYPGNSVTDPLYGSGYKVIRGGSFKTGYQLSKVSSRDARDPMKGYFDVGFRGVYDIPAGKSVVEIPGPRYTFYLFARK